MGEQGPADRAGWEGEMFRLLAENVVDYAIFVVDPHRHVLSWSHGAERLLGFAEAEIIGRQCDCFFTPEDVAAAIPQKELEQALATGRGDDDRWHVRKDGTRFWASGSVTPLKDEGGRLRGFAKIMRDRTDLKRAADELAASRRRLQALFDNALDAVLLADDRGRYVDANPAACTLLGYDRDQVLRLGVSDVTPPPVADAGRAAWAAFLRDGRQEGEYTIRRRDGTAAVVEFRAVANVLPGLHLSVLRDVTERGRVRAALERSEARLAAVFEALPVGVGVADAAGAVVLANREMHRYLPTGVLPSRDDDRHRRWVARWPDGRPVERADFPAARALRGESVVPGVEMRYTHDDGTEVWAQVAAVPIRDGEGRVAGQVAVVTDVDALKRAEQALRASEARLAEAQRIAGVGSWEVDWPTQRVWWSAETYRLFGFEPGGFEPTVEGFLALVPAEDRPAIRRTIDAALAGTAEYRSDHRVVRADGAVRWVSEQAEVAFGPDGEPVRVVGTVLDITDRVRAGEALRESEGRLRMLSDNLPDGAVYQTVATSDGGRRFAFISAGVERVFGVTPAEATADAAALYGLVHEDDRGRLTDAEAVALRDNTPFDCEFRSRTRGGDVRWVHCRSAPRRLPDGETVWEGVVLDVTARKEAERGLHDQHALTATIADTATTALFVMDAGGRTTFMNPAAEEMTGFRCEEVRGLVLHDCVHHHRPDGTPFPMADCPIGRHTLGRQPLRGHEDVFVRRDGTFFPVRCSASPLLRDGELAGIVLEAQDITEQRRAMEALRDADRRKDEFLATLAHELRNPLAPLRNGLQVLRLARGDRAAAERAMGMMDRQLSQMVHLIDDLLDVSRITRGKLHLRRERVDLAAVVQNAVEASRPLVEASAHRLTVALPPDPVYLDADPTRLAQVLANLLTNAAKYTERGGDIRLTARRDGGRVVVSVRDAGIGISAEHLPRLFEMFSQVDSALERSQGGLGIGLALVRGLVEMHGGTVEARSEGLGRGSEFTVWLPVPGETSGGAAGPKADDGAAAPRPRRRVLVADDSRDAADSLAMMLQLAGHEVHAAHDGREAVEAAGWFRPDVVLLDIGMPVLNGYEAARRIRGQPWGGGMTLVALTGWGQDEDKRRAAEAGFDRHLTKPVDPAELEKLLAGPSRAT